MADDEACDRAAILEELRRIRARLGELERSERALALEPAGAVEARARAVLENSYDMFAELDANGIYTWASANVEDLLGYAWEDLDGRFVLDLVHPDDLERTTAGLATVLELGRVRQHAYRLRRKDGAWIWLETSASTYTHECGALRILAVSRDVTEQRRHLEEREEAIRDKETALAQLKVLSGLLPICTHCRRVRDDEGYWRSLEAYVSDHSAAIFSHSLCEGCLREHYGHIVGSED